MHQIFLSNQLVDKTYVQSATFRLEINQKLVLTMIFESKNGLCFF